MEDLTTTTSYQILNKQCPSHPSFKQNMLVLDPNFSKHRVCSQCMIEQEVVGKCILISELYSQKQSISQSENIEQDYQQQLENDCEKLCDKIEEYYLQLAINIENAICNLIKNNQQKIKSQLLEWKDSNQDKKNILEILKKEDKNEEKLLHNYITNQSVTIEKIKNPSKSFQEFENSLSKEIPFQAQQDIMMQIRAIDFPTIMSKVAQQSENQSTSFIPYNSETQQNLSIPKIAASTEFQNTKLLKFQIDKVDKKLVISKDSTDFVIYRQCFLENELKPKQKYQIKLELNNQYDNYPYFIFGLIDPSKAKTNGIWEEGIYYSQFDGGFATNVKKGKEIHSNELQKIGIKKLQFDVQIEKKLFKVFSQDNEVELINKENIDPKKSYCFAIAICNPSDSVKIIEVIGK